jgi:hypothetical protein
MSGGKARAACVLLPTMARLNDHQRNQVRERLDAFHKLLLGIILHGRMGRPWGSGAIARAGCY